MAPSFKALAPWFNDRPSMLLRSWATPMVAHFLSALKLKDVRSRASLDAVWEKDPLFPLAETSPWVHAPCVGVSGGQAIFPSHAAPHPAQRPLAPQGRGGRQQGGAEQTQFGSGGASFNGVCRDKAMQSSRSKSPALPGPKNLMGWHQAPCRAWSYFWSSSGKRSQVSLEIQHTHRP